MDYVESIPSNLDPFKSYRFGKFENGNFLSLKIKFHLFQSQIELIQKVSSIFRVLSILALYSLQKELLL